MSSGSYSPTNNSAPQGFDGAFSAFDRGVSADGVSSNAGASSDIVNSNAWSTHDYDNESRMSGFDSVGSDPAARSRRSIERDALRKYVRQRYSAKR